MPATKPVPIEDTPTEPLPSLSADIYARLRDSIADRGMLVPILRDVGGEVLDGRQRLRWRKKSESRTCPR